MSVTVFDPLKALGKRISWVRALNSQFKCVKLKQEYARTIAHYNGRQQSKTSLLRTALARRVREKAHIFEQAGRLRLFFIGTDELQDRSGIIQALERVSQLKWFTRSDGSYGQNYQGTDEARRKSNSDRLRDIFMEFERTEWIPDALIAQTWAGYVDPKILGYIQKRYGTLIINIGMDDRHQYWGRKVDGEWWGTRGLIPYIDLALTAAPECVEWYQKEGCPALFFPEASDPAIFCPMPELPKIHEVCFVGGRYGIREKIVNSLRRAGIRVTAYGSGWEGGRLETNDVPRLFAQSKIVLGIGTIGHCEDFYALKMRDFDGPMSGSLYLTHDNPDLRLLYKVGDEIVTYRSIEECIDKAKRLLSHDEERERIAMAGRARASADHSWDKRFNDLFAVLRKDLTPLGHPLQSQ